MNDHPADGFPTLVVAGGPRNGESLALDSPGLEKILGSGPDCHMRFAGSSVDHHHAGVFWDEAAGVLISDQASATGTWVNGERVTAPRVLQDGDRISLGPPGSAESVKLLVQIPPQLEAPLVLDTDDDAGLPLAAPAFPPPAAPAAPSLPDDDDVFDAGAEAPALPASTFVAPPAPASAPPTAAAPPRPPAPPPKPAVVFKDEDEPPRRAVFTDELPAIVSEEPRAAAPFHPVSIPAIEGPRTARRSKGKMLPLVVGAAAVFLAGAGAWVAVGLVSRPVPALTSAQPARAEPGQAVVLTGTGFQKDAGGNVVRFGEEQASVSSASATQLTVTVPASLDSASEVAVTVETRGGRSNALRLPLRHVPRVTAIEPDVALPGAEVVLKGQKLDLKDIVVLIGAQRATVKEARPTQLRVVVPPVESMIEGQVVNVSVQAGGDSARPLTLTLGHLPLLTKLDPPRGEAGDRVVVRGRGFDPDPAGNAVTFAGEPAVVVTASDRQLDVIVPAVPSGGNLFNAPVVVSARGSASGGPFEFTLLRPSSTVFVPRFFPAQVPSDTRRTFVSSEAGPLFLLSSADGHASTAERAQKVAAAVNALFAPGAGGAALEARGDPPAVFVAGAAQPLVRATAEDAAGYAQPWNAAMKGQRVSASALAAHWAALVQDYVTLFVQHQRPTRVVEVSPRGKVLLELHALGERSLGPGGGVPAALLMPPGPVMAQAMRELALGVPARAQSVPGAALVGRWAGTMEETEGGVKAFQLQLRLDGTRLAGSFSTSAGKLSMDVPLKSVAYEKGTLSFELAGGPVRKFRGSAAGSTLSGTIFDQAQKQTGRFTLQYAE